MAKTVMLVDDSATMRKIIMKTIRMADVGVEEFKEASNGEEALAKLAEGPVDVVLCDINMPVMNGAEFVKKARANSDYDNVKILIVSTESSDDFIKSMMADGANDYVTKPFTPEKIQTKLEPLLA